MPDLLASYLAAVATFCAVTALLPVLREPLAWLRTAIEIVSVEAPPSLATAAFLGILAAAVRRRMRAAWWFVVLYLVLGRILGWITVLIDTDAQDPVVVLRRIGHPRLAAGGVRGGGARAVAAWPASASRRVPSAAAAGAPSGSTSASSSSAASSAGACWSCSRARCAPRRTASAGRSRSCSGGLGDPDVTGVDGAAPYAVTFVLGLVGVFAVLAAAYVLFRPRRDQRRL